MTSRRSHRTFANCLLALTLLAAAESALAERFYASSGRADFFNLEGAIRAREVPDLVLSTRVLDQIDPLAGPILLICSLQARADDGFTPIAGARARWTASLLVLDLTSGEFSIQSVGSGKTKTGNPGTAFSFPIDPSAFPDGYGPDMLAYVETSFRMRNRKLVHGLTALCELGVRVAE